MRKIGSFGFAVFLTVLTSTAIAQGPPPAPPTPLAAPEGYHQPEYDASALSRTAKCRRVRCKETCCNDTSSRRLGYRPTLHQGDRVFVNEGRVRNNRPPSPVDWQKVTSMNGDTGSINGNYIAPER
jgi:hypothetical protein